MFARACGRVGALVVLHLRQGGVQRVLRALPYQVGLRNCASVQRVRCAVCGGLVLGQPGAGEPVCSGLRPAPACAGWIKRELSRTPGIDRWIDRYSASAVDSAIVFWSLDCQ